MQITQTAIPGLLCFTPVIHRDSRGFFMESWREEWREELGLANTFVQDNHARSEEAGVLRGLHFQYPPAAQSKLVWVTQGAVYDVAVDLRVGSPTFASWFGVILSAENGMRVYVPRGFAHGYMTLTPGTEVQYKVDNYYSPKHDAGILWDDPDLGISWPDIPAILSEKDSGLPRLKNITSPFIWGK